MIFISFTSGSCGNCCYIGTDGPDSHGVLIDAGASMRKVKREMFGMGLGLSSINAILVTHEHLDHIRFLGTFCKYLEAPVYTTGRIHSALASHPFTKDHIAACRRVVDEQEWNLLSCGFEVKCFTVPHDAVQTVGYAIKAEDRLFVLMTDLEHVTEEAMELASKADTVVIESNYDIQMLQNGPYPPELKTRILKEGHLSNDACAEAVKKIWHPGLKNLFLCHLSGNNNTPQIAWNSTAAALESIGVQRGSINLRTLERERCSPLIRL